MSPCSKRLGEAVLAKLLCLGRRSVVWGASWVFSECLFVPRSRSLPAFRGFWQSVFLFLTVIGCLYVFIILYLICVENLFLLFVSLFLSEDRYRMVSGGLWCCFLMMHLYVLLFFIRKEWFLKVSLFSYGSLACFNCRLFLIEGDEVVQ